MKSSTINLLDICRHGSRTLGPGNRYIVWTQGCPFRCQGCITPEGRPDTPNMIADIKSLAKDIVLQKDIDGLTISGGEPFMQSGEILELIKTISADRPDMNILIFTGYRIEELIWNEAQEILEYTDVLIDGPYIPEKNDGIGLRGSSNQRVHILKERMEPYREEMEKGHRKIEIEVNDNYTRTIGIPLKK